MIMEDHLDGPSDIMKDLYGLPTKEEVHGNG